MPYRKTGTFTAPGTGEPARLYRRFNLTLWGTFTGTFTLERRFRDDETWHRCADATGAENLITAPGSFVFNEPETGVFYRLTCLSLDAGEAYWRLSQ